MIYLFMFLILQNYAISGDKKSERVFLTEEEIKNSEDVRAKQVLQCAQCHNQQYKEWVKGPHANAYKMLMYQFENSKFEKPFGYLTAEQSHNLNVLHKDKCLNCHNPPNIMEQAYDHFKSSGGQLTSKEINTFWDNQKKIRDEKSSTTSIDCLTCHVKNNKVLVKETPQSQSQYGEFPHVQGDIFIGRSENNCIACHEEAIIYVAPKNSKPSENSCLSCHASKENNRYTHNIFWRHGLGDGVSSAKEFYGVFDFISVRKKNKNTAVLKWELSKSPHSIAICSALVILVDGVDSSDRVVWRKNINVNRQDDFIKMYKWDIGSFAKDFPDQYTESYTLGPKSADVVVEIPMKELKIKSIKLKGYFKVRFWLDLETKKPIYERMIKLD